jgi:membrane protein
MEPDLNSGSAGGRSGPHSSAGRVVIGTLRDWVRHDATSHSAALAFYTLFSLAPVLILVVSIAGYFVGTDVAEGAVFSQLQGVLGTSFSEGIRQLLQAAIASGDSSKANLVATIVLIVGSTSTFSELKSILDTIWEEEPKARSGLWQLVRTKLLSLGLILLLSALLLVALGVGLGLGAFEQFWSARWPAAVTLLKPLSWAVSFTVIACLFGMIYKALPPRHLRWRDVLVGAITSALLFTLGRMVIGVYLSHGRLMTIYGAASSAVVLISWVYYSALVFLLGAEFTHQYALAFSGGSSPPPPDAARKVPLDLPPRPLGPADSRPLYM